MKDQRTIVFASIDEEKFTEKPNSKDAALITNRIAKRFSGFYLEDFISEIEQGCTFTPGLFACGIRSIATWTGQNMIVADIDNTATKDRKKVEYHIEDSEHISMSGFIDICKNHDFPLPAAIIPTFNHSEDQHKFRAIWVLEKSVDETGDKIIDAIYKAMIRLFPFIDKSAATRATMFYGTKHKAFMVDNTRTITPEEFLITAEAAVANATDPTNKARAVKQFRNSVDFDAVLSPRGTCKSDDFWTSPLYNIGPGLDSSNLHSYSSTTGSRIRGLDIPRAELLAGCRILREMEDGQLFDYHVRYGLTLNLIHVHGCKNWFFELLAKSGCNEIQIEKAIVNWRHAEKKEYHPQRCEGFCEYCKSGECISSGNIISTCHLSRGRIQYIKQPVFQPLDEVSVLFTTTLQEILSGDDHDIHIIRADTGIGKTEALLGLLDTIIAVPTHKLKNEILQRAVQKGFNLASTPELPDKMAESDRTKIESLYATGCFSTANAYLHALSRDPLVPGSSDIKRYLSAIDDLLKTTKTIVSTHTRIAHIGSAVKHNTIIFDEDPFRTLVPISIASLSDVAMLLTTGDKKLESYANTALNAESDKLYKQSISYLNSRTKLEPVISKTQATSNVLGFIEASHFIKHGNKIIFTNKVELPAKKKIIILSATASETLWRALYGSRVKFHDLPLIERKGQLIQYLGNFSRHKLRQKPELVAWLKESTKSMKVISFKEFSGIFSSVAHFNALEGIDSLNGLDLAIIGTPHVNPFAYMLISAQLGHAHTTYSDMRYMPVSDEYFRFYLMSYAEGPEVLRDIQTWMIRSELEQAVGRARLLRNDSKVIVFADYPLPGAEIILFKN